MELFFTRAAIACLIICGALWIINNYAQKKVDDSVLFGTYKAPEKLNLLEELMNWAPGWVIPISYLMLSNLTTWPIYINLILSIIVLIVAFAAIVQWDVEKQLGGNLFSFCLNLPGAVIGLLKGISLTIWGKLRKAN